MNALELNFYADWIEFLRHQLTEYGDPPKPGTSDEKVEFLYFNVVKRAIQPRPRRVNLPDGFKPPVDLEVDFEKFIADATAGVSLRPYLSRGLKDADYNDSCLNDWGIHHFHLGSVVESDGFFARRGPLLFARVTKECIYVCGFFSHGAWADYGVMEVLHTNWPTSLELFKLTGMIPVSPRPSPEELVQARRAGLMVPLQMLDGTLYTSPGGGITTAKLGLDVVSNADRHHDWIRCLENQVRDELPKLKQQIETTMNRKLRGFTFKLVFRDGLAFAIEHTSGVALELGPVPQ